MDLRAKRVRMALRVPGGVVGVKIPKDEGRWGRREMRRVKDPSARGRRGAKRGDIDIKKRNGAVAEVQVGA